MLLRGFNELYAKYKGELTVVITRSAAPLAQRHTSSKLESVLKQSQAAQQAKTLKVVNKVRYLSMHACYMLPKLRYVCQVNPDVLGGVVVDFGDKTIDLSVSSTVNKLNGVLQRLYC